jgi:hypothetical protein
VLPNLSPKAEWPQFCEAKISSRSLIFLVAGAGFEPATSGL